MSKEIKYTLGLDIGIASVGWSIINNDKERIERLGVRIFDKAECPKDGSSLALPRRIKRGLRRRLRRRRFRISEIKELFVKTGLITREELDKLYTNAKFEKSPWELRCIALDEKLANEDLIRVLIHLAKRRGYLSNRKSDEEDKDSDAGKMKSGIIENVNLMNEKKYRTAGEMIWKDEKFDLHKRNKGGEYGFSVNRYLLKEEAGIILNKQKELGNELITDDFIDEYLRIWNLQYPYASKEQIEKMIGNCSLDPTEKRAAKAGYTAERFVALQKINNLRIIGNSKRNDGKLSDEEREKVIALVYKNKVVKYSQIRKEIDLTDNEKFKDINYRVKEKDKNKNPEDKAFFELKFRNKVKEVITKNISEEKWKEIENNVDMLDDIGTALTLYKTDDDIEEFLISKNVDDVVIEQVEKLSFKEVMHVSLKAMKNINVYLEKGLTYSNACSEAGYDFKGITGGDKQKLLPVINKEEVKNPVVLRALTQTRKVINAIINEYGSPYEIHIEFARDMAKTFDERQNIRKRQEENYATNDGIKSKLINEVAKDVFKNKAPTAMDVLKYKLYEEQGAKCLYSLKPLDINQLFDDGYVQIDHAIPYSRSYNDSYMNKVLVLTSENQNKGNRTPYEYLSSDEQKWNNYFAYVWSLNIPINKKEMITKEKWTREDASNWKSRNINDTRYIAVYIKNYIENNLLFNDYGDKPDRKKVVTLNGAMTDYLRHAWGLKKDRTADDTHHAMDATVIAACTNKNIKNVTDYVKVAKETIHQDGHLYNVDEETGELIEVSIKDNVNKFAPQPWNGFRDELSVRMMSLHGDNLDCEFDMQKLLEEYIIKYERQDSFDDIDLKEFKPIFVSKMPKRKVSGAAHKETIYSKKVFTLDDVNRLSDVCVKKPIKTLKLKDIDNMVGKETDMMTYNLLRERLINFKDVPEKAFNEPVYKIKKDGTNGPEIKTLKIKENMKNGVDVNGGRAANDSMIRVDVFEKDGKNYLVPIYVADTKKKELPNRAITAGKDYSEWIVMDDTYNFKFSLYPNDIVKVQNKGKIKAVSNDNKKIEFAECYGYYKNTHSGTSAITIEAIDGCFIAEGIGVKVGNIIFDKYCVDVLGNYNKVGKEKRIGF